MQVATDCQNVPQTTHHFIHYYIWAGPLVLRAHVGFLSGPPPCFPFCCPCVGLVSMCFLRSYKINLLNKLCRFFSSKSVSVEMFFGRKVFPSKSFSVEKFCFSQQVFPRRSVIVFPPFCFSVGMFFCRFTLSLFVLQQNLAARAPDLTVGARPVVACLLMPRSSGLARCYWLG